MIEQTNEVLGYVLAERMKQNKQWGDQSGHSLYKWLTILAEEVGELAEAALYGNEVAAREEAIHVAAVATAIAEQLDQGGLE